MEELQKLQSEFMQLQHQQAVQRLSDRVCADILIKLIQTKQIDLFYTIDGKEYLTPSQLHREILDELYVQQGRLNCSDLQTILNVDIFYIEQKAREIAQKDPYIHYDSGELLTEHYFDRISEEIEESLQEVGQLNVSDLAKRFNLPTEMLIGVIEKRLDNSDHPSSKKKVMIRGRLEPPLLFTQTFVEKHKAIVRGLFSAVTVPTPVYPLLQQYRFHDSLFFSIIEELIQTGRLLGTMQGRLDKTMFIPRVYSQNRTKSIDQFFIQNGFIEYEKLTKLQITEPTKYLKQRFPNGYPLITCYLSEHEFLQADDAISDAISRNEWIDLSALVPSPLTESDIGTLIQLSPSFQKGSLNHLIFSHSTIISNGFINQILTRFNDYFMEMAKNSPTKLKSSQEINNNINNKLRTSTGDSKSKLSNSNSNINNSNDNLRNSNKSISEEEEEDIPKNNKKNARGKKQVNKKKNQLNNSNNSNNNNNNNSPARSDSLLDFDELEKKIKEWEEEYPKELCKPLLLELRSRLESMRDEASKILFSNSEAKKKFENNDWQNELAKIFWNIDLFLKGAQKFKDGERTEIEKYILKTLCADGVNTMIELSMSQCFIELDGNISSISDRNNALKKLSKHPKIFSSLSSLNKSLSEDCTKYMEELMEVADSIGGVRLKKLDKRSEKQLVETHFQLYKTQLEGEENVPNAYHIVVLLLFTKYSSLVVSLPAKLLPAVIDIIKGQMEGELLNEVTKFGGIVREYLTAKIKKQENEAELLSQLTSSLPAFKEVVLKAADQINWVPNK